MAKNLWELSAFLNLPCCDSVSPWACLNLPMHDLASIPVDISQSLLAQFGISAGVFPSPAEWFGILAGISHSPIARIGIPRGHLLLSHGTTRRPCLHLSICCCATRHLGTISQFSMASLASPRAYICQSLAVPLCPCGHLSNSNSTTWPPLRHLSIFLARTSVPRLLLISWDVNMHPHR